MNIEIKEKNGRYEATVQGRYPSDITQQIKEIVEKEIERRVQEEYNTNVTEEVILKAKAYDELSPIIYKHWQFGATAGAE